MYFRENVSIISLSMSVLLIKYNPPQQLGLPDPWGQPIHHIGS